MATYNGAPYVQAQLQSILASPRVAEVLVSDDGSNDDTQAIIRSFDDPRVRLLQGPGQGVVRNFEFLLGQARGEVIFLADQDDVWLPGKVDNMMKALAGADLVVSDCAIVDSQMRTLHPSFFSLRRSGPGLLRNLARNSYIGCCMAMRRKLLQHALPFPPNVAMHDWWLGLVAQCTGRVFFLDQVLLLYRRHGGNLSSSGERSIAPVRQRFMWRLQLLCWLFIRRWRGAFQAMSGI
ncbi:glycosyltransferase family 2 protein [Hylemonella sp. W303a]|uniref:glycosyltransferase family 2 protein n=1 Tax=Hylemonella sp. W303a TaxID=3389873 RepID=UPI00396B30A5